MRVVCASAKPSAPMARTARLRSGCGRSWSTDMRLQAKETDSEVRIVVTIRTHGSVSGSNPTFGGSCAGAPRGRERCADRSRPGARGAGRTPWPARYRGPPMSGRDRYAAVLGRPHVLPLVLASMLARLPVGIEGLAVVLYISQARGSFAAAGLVSGGFAIGAALGAPLQSRLIDRMGQRAVLLPAALGNAAAVGGLIALTEIGAPAGVLAAIGVVGGVSTANI